jgi:hypothetical protein
MHVRNPVFDVPDERVSTWNASRTDLESRHWGQTMPPTAAALCNIEELNSINDRLGDLSTYSRFTSLELSIVDPGNSSSGFSSHWTVRLPQSL